MVNRVEALKTIFDIDREDEVFHSMGIIKLLIAPYIDQTQKNLL